MNVDITRSLALALAGILVSQVACAAGEEITIVTRDGQTIHGRLVSETERGFLIAKPEETVMVEYGRVTSVQRGAAEATAAPATPSASEATARGTDLAVGFGVLWGPTLSERSVMRYFEVGPTAQLVVEIGGSRLRFRVVPMLTGGFVGPNVWRKFVELSVGAEARLYLTPNYAVGFGVFAGGGAGLDGLAGNQWGGFGVAGPSITPLDLRFGATGRHELQLWIGGPVDLGNGGSNVLIRPVLTYALHF